MEWSDLEIVVITGMSGSGKSVALNALEDAGYYCVDNLPPELLRQFAELVRQNGMTRIAIAMDVRSASALPQLPGLLRVAQQMGVVVKPLFLDATTDTLVRRYSESRRKHPLSGQVTQTADGNAQDERRALVDAIELERELLGQLRELSHVIDSSLIRPAQLQSYVKTLIAAPGGQLTLVFESFAFKRGIPSDADFVFDVRMLPNPHYEHALRELTGMDAPVADYLRQQASVLQMQEQISQFLHSWLDTLVRDHRSYVTVAIGCTGGQHRSVYLVEQLYAHFHPKWNTLKRHREMDAIKQH
ncbi:RNase adapter RapZ [Curvibacter sp. CHRR-16]|uniref:RNase adapter RapZ n=1 Tax=Curvibacter sp. CHRR-16 TaxID=2835872 RepID=UPI001BDA91CC|nr:RNase adapter RapZ [Curvibacter sp. CHRR-16]MBT0569584.1 RNase adapter RapZ [Curvibacter sp. CHRR-16]